MKFSKNELHAYVGDGREGDARRGVEAYLAQAPEDAARVAAYREQNAALRAVFDPVIEEPLPERLRSLKPNPHAARIAVAAAWLALGAAIGWFAHAVLADRPYAWASFPGQAAAAHAVYSPDVPQRG